MVRLASFLLIEITAVMRALVYEGNESDVPSSLALLLQIPRRNVC